MMDMSGENAGCHFKMPDEYLKGKFGNIVVYNINNVEVFRAIRTEDVAEFFNKDPEYINAKVWNGRKIRKNGKWYTIKRIKE